MQALIAILSKVRLLDCDKKEILKTSSANHRYCIQCNYAVSMVNQSQKPRVTLTAQQRPLTCNLETQFFH